jgi:cytochrome c556
MKRIHFTMLLALAVLAGGVARAATPDEIIAGRQAGFKHIGDMFFGSMKKGIESGQDVTTFATGAKEIADWGRKIPSEFPAGTETGHNTHAQPTVWSDRSGFETAAANLVTQADKLAAVAAAGDKAGFAAQWQTTGGACGACHTNQKYRTRL